MRFGITSRLFAAILATNVLIGVAFVAATQLSDHGPPPRPRVDDGDRPPPPPGRDRGPGPWDEVFRGERPRGPGMPPPVPLLDAMQRIERGSALPPSDPALRVPVSVGGTTVGHLAAPGLPFARVT